MSSKKSIFDLYFFDMRFLTFILLFFSLQIGFAQETFSPTKINKNQIILDGLLSEKIWENATKIPLDIEFNPANNFEARKKTTAYITYSDTYLFIAFRAEDTQKISEDLFAREMILIFGMMIL